MEINRQVELSILKKYHKELWTPFARAITRYELIKEGDRIAVCISGGKDSMLLAKLMQMLHSHSEVHFDVEYIVMDPGYSKENRAKIERNAKLHSANFEGMELIRPLYMIHENDIIRWCKYNGLEFIRCACRFTEKAANDGGVGDSKRLEIKELIKTLKKTNPVVDSNIFHSLHTVNIDTFPGYTTN